MSTDPTLGEDSIALTYFNDFEARTIEAIAERIIPGGDGEPGATEAGVVYYIDRAVAGFSASLQKVYRLGLRQLERYCRLKYAASFVDLDARRQDDAVRRFLGPEIASPSRTAGHDPMEGVDQIAATEDRTILDRLFAVIREHALEGMFCDPVYGGNRNMAGWRLVGFPGVHWGYTAEQMREGFDGRQLPMRSLSDLRRNLKVAARDSSSMKSDGR